MEWATRTNDSNAMRLLDCTRNRNAPHARTQHATTRADALRSGGTTTTELIQLSLKTQHDSYYTLHEDDTHARTTQTQHESRNHDNDNDMR